MMDAPMEKELGTTLGGNALGCVAGLEVIRMIEGEKLNERAKEIGEIIRSTLDFPSEHIGEIRGLGAMIGIEFVKDKQTKEPYPELVKEIIRNCHQRGVIVITAGMHGNIIRLLPPLTITDEQLKEALNVLVQAITESELVVSG